MAQLPFSYFIALALVLVPAIGMGQERGRDGWWTSRNKKEVSQNRAPKPEATTKKPSQARNITTSESTPGRSRIVQTSANESDIPSVKVAQAIVAESPSLPTPLVPSPDTPQMQPSTTANLRDLIGLAQTMNPILRSSGADIEAAKGERVQASLYPNPRMETNNPEIWAGQQSFVNFGFQQDIVTKGKMRMERAAADQLVRREQAGFQLDRMKMLTEIRRQYFATLAAKHRLQVAQHIVVITQKGSNAAKQLEAAGEASETDVLLLDTEVQRAISREEAARSLFEGELKQLPAVVGMPDLVFTDIEGSLLTKTPEFDEHELRLFVSTQSAMIEMSYAESIRNKTLLRRAEVEPYPNIRMGPSYQTGTVPDSSQFWLSVVFEIPVWDMNQGNILKARALVSQSEANIDVVRNELIGKAADLFSRHRASSRMADRIRTSILPNAQRTMHLVQEGYNKGQFDVNRLLQAQHNLTEMAEEYIETSEKAWVISADIAGLLQVEEFP